MTTDDIGSASPLERLAAHLNDLTPERRALLQALYLPMEGYPVDALYMKTANALLRMPLDVPVLKDRRLTEPLVNLDGHVLVLGQLSTFEFE